MEKNKKFWEILIFLDSCVIRRWNYFNTNLSYFIKIRIQIQFMKQIKSFITC